MRAKDREREKQVAIFFLPQVAPGEYRDIEIRYDWPGYFAKWVTKGRTEYFARFKAKSDSASADVKRLARMR